MSQLVRRALSTALKAFRDNSPEWENCWSALNRVESLVQNGDFVDSRTKKNFLSILNEALEQMSECDLPFLIQDIEDLIAEVKALGIADQGCRVPG